MPTNPRFVKVVLSNVVKSLVDFFPTLDFQNDQVNFIQMQAEGGEIRYRYDGDADPTTNEGMLQKSSDPPFYLQGVARLTALRMIRNAAVDVAVSITIDHVDR